MITNVKIYDLDLILSALNIFTEYSQQHYEVALCITSPSFFLPIRKIIKYLRIQKNNPIVNSRESKATVPRSESQHCFVPAL